MKKIFTLILMALLPMITWADTVEIDGIYYNLSLTEGTAVVTKNPNKYTGKVNIPESVTYEDAEFRVTSIGREAFSSCVNLTSVSIPNGVTYIGDYAFKDCNKLNFVNIPNSVTWIGVSAFYECRSLISVSIPNSVTAIGESTFYNCHSLTSVTIGNSVTSIGNSAFYGCNGLTSVTIPNSVTSIGGMGFYACTSLTSIIIPESVTSIGDGAFRSCSSLTSVSIPNSVSSINSKTFQGCSSLTSIVIPNSVTYIGSHAFYSCSGLTSVTIGDSVTEISEGAFRDCINLTSITIPNSVTRIGQLAFNGCSALKFATIGSGVTLISNNAFAYCQELEVLYCFARNVPRTPNSDTFKNTPIGNATLYVPTSSIEQYKAKDPWNGFGTVTSLDNIDGIYYNFNGDEAEVTYLDYNFNSYSGNIVIPAFITAVWGKNYTVTSIGEYAFKNCSNMSSVTIPNSVDSIGTAAFNDCSSLTDVYCLSESVPQTHSTAFDNSPINSATLHAPNRSLHLYKASTPWNKFGGYSGLYGNTYTLSYLIDGSEYKSYNVWEEEKITPEPAPTKEGHTFSGWSEIPETMPDHDVEVNGTFSINSYTLTYMVNGETYKTSTIVYGTAITPEEEPVKEGHTFSGWSEIPKTMPAHDVTVTGSFTINSYTLTYMVDGEVYKTERVTYGTALSPENEPTKTGYTFSGWSEIPETMPAQDVTVTGSFSINSYTLTYILDGEVYKTESVVYGTPLEEEPALTKEGYTFSGWSAIPETMPARDVTVTGSFTINSYTLTYMLDGEVYKTSTVVYGTEIIPEPALTKEGYTFSGWSEIPETMPASDVVVTGSFSINSYILVYLVDGKEYLTLTLDYGTAITPEEEPTREGYTFSGWSKIPETMPAHDVVVTGSFTINQYILAYILDGEEYKSYKLDYNTPIKPEVMPVKKGMTFSGWGEVPEKMPAHDVTLTGSYSWSRETYDYVIYQVADTLNNYASVVGYHGTDEEVEILQEVIIGEDAYTVHGIAEDALPETVTICVPLGKLLLWLWEDGYDNLQETGSGRSLAAPELSLVGATSSSLSMSFTNEIAELGETVTLLGKPVEKGEEGYDLTLRGLEPDNLYEGVATFTLTCEDVAYTKTYSFRTEAMTLTTQQPKVVSLGNVIVAAESNLDDEETNVGFEWRRTDWTEDFTSSSGEAYLYEGTMEGYIHNLNTDKLWKYRPYYESNAGNRYYGNWVGIDPTNISYFEPTVHTYATINVSGNTAVVKGYAMRGTDNVTSQGFIYWSTNSPSSLRKVNGIPSDAKTVIAGGNIMTSTLENLEYETEYCCVAFVTTAEGETFYGESQIFRTDPVDPDGIKEIENGQLSTDNEAVAIYDLNGRKLAAPQKGINIIRYSDGTSKKVLVK